jgi:hypothetical protein
MHLTNWISSSVAKWTLAVGIATAGTFGSQAMAHHPFHRHGCFGLGGWGSSHFGYSSFYSYRSSYAYPSFSFGYLPRYYSVSYYTPTYFAPVYYSPAYCTPAYYAPTYYPPTYYAPACYSWSGTNFSVSTPLASSTTPRYSAFADSGLPGTTQANTNRMTSPLSMPSRTALSKLPIAGIPVSKSAPVEGVEGKSVSKEYSVQLVSHKPALVQPYSPIWTKAAVGIVDEMIAAGELDHAHSSCKGMERVTQPKGAGVYLRQSLLGYFSADENASNPSSEEALNLLELACQAGSQVQPSELNRDSLRSYFSACIVDVSGAMENLSQSVLASPGNSSRELLLLSALLKLDGQTERSRLFAAEVQSQIGNSGSFKWHNVLNACLTDTL